MTVMNRMMTGTALAIAIGTAPLAAFAEASAPTTAPAQAQSEAPAATQAADVSDEKLEAFVVAMAEIQDVRETYTPRIQQAETDSERQEIANEGNAAIRERVENVDGISFDEFVQIAEAAQDDPALGARLNERLAVPPTE